MPKDGKDAVGKALMAHCGRAKGGEIEEMLEEGDDDGEQRKDGEKVEDDFGEEIIREEIKDVDREVLRKAKATIECTFTFLKALVVPLISKRSNSNNKSRIDRATALNEIEKKCKEIRRAVDEIICEAMPPSDAVLLATEAKKLKDAAENMMKRVEEVMTDNDAPNDGQTDMNLIEPAKKALGTYNLQALKCNCTRAYDFTKQFYQRLPRSFPSQTLLVYENISFSIRGCHATCVLTR